MGQLKKACNIFERALEIRKKVNGSGNRNTVGCARMLALIYMDMGDNIVGISLLKQLLLQC